MDLKSSKWMCLTATLFIAIGVVCFALVWMGNPTLANAVYLVLMIWAFARAYREMPGPHAPIVVITAAHDALDRMNEIGAFGVLPKPFDLDQLLDEVERCFREIAG